VNNPENLDKIFWSLLAGKFPEVQIAEFNKNLTQFDAKWMMEYIEKLKGPDDLNEYVEADNVEMGIIVEGFFKFLDLVSALIINLGSEAIQEAQQFQNSQSTYVSWVLKYCSDERFHDRILDSFPQIKS